MSHISVFALLGGMAVSASWAQDVTPGAADATTSSRVEAQSDGRGVDIIVTGSRIAQRGFAASAPVTVLDSQDIQKLGLVNAGDVVAELPQNVAYQTPANVGAGNFNIGVSLGNLRGLNPFFGTRTLTLVNTRRFVPTTDTGAVDLNVIPSMLIQRVETVTGGASAAYGSDAIAGVINIILDTKLEGFRGQIDHGLTSHGDGADSHVSVAYGTGFGNDRGHIVIGGEYEKADAIGGCAQVRSWCATNYGMYNNPNFAATPAGALFPGSPAVPANGDPNFVIGPNARTINSTTGFFPFAPIGPTVFDASGTTLVPFAVGNYYNLNGFPATQQGGADPTQDLYRNVTLRPLVKHGSAFGHAEYDLTDSIQAYVEGSYAGRRAVNVQANSGAYFNTIYADNPYLPAGTAALLGLPAYDPLIPGGPNFISDGQIFPAATNKTKSDTYRGVAGLSGKLGGNWSWDAYYTYGRNVTHQQLLNSQVNNFFAYAIDAVSNTDPALGPIGTPVCRQALLGNPDAAGCVPLDLFGSSNANPAAVAYAYRTLHQDEVYQQQVASGSIHGDLWQGWGAGPIGVAAGIEYRREDIDVTHNQAAQPYYPQFARGYGADYHAASEVTEGFAEVNVPILKDVPLVKSLSVDGAVRQTHDKAIDQVSNTSRSMNFTTWKASGIWEINDWVRLRATRSRDARAPSFYEQYAVSVTSGAFGQVTNPTVGNAIQIGTLEIGGAGPNLKPEKADTWTAGLVLTGHGALSRFQASVDWYQVNLHGAISTLGSAQGVVNACYLYGSYCNLITPGAGATQVGDLQTPGSGYTNLNGGTIRVPYLNLGKYITRGLDMEADYNLPIRTANLNFRVIASYLYDLIIDTGTGGPVYNYAGYVGPTTFNYYNPSPKWQGNAFITYSQGGLSGTVQARYVGSGKYLLLNPNTGLPFVAPSDPGYSPSSPNSINENHVKSAIYINLSASYRLPVGNDAHRWVELFGLVDNVFNKKPRIAPGGNGYPTNPVFFDTYGTAFKVGVRVSY